MKMVRVVSSHIYAWVARTRQTKQTNPKTVQVIFLKTDPLASSFRSNDGITTFEMGYKEVESP